jgi:hypothetical protein
MLLKLIHRTVKQNTDLAVDQLQQAVIFFHNNCPTKRSRSPRKVFSWNKKLGGLRAKTKPFSVAKRVGHWDISNETLTCYNKDIRKAKRILMGKPKGKRPLGRPRRRWVDNIKMDLSEIRWDGVDWSEQAHNRDQ